MLCIRDTRHVNTNREPHLMPTTDSYLRSSSQPVRNNPYTAQKDYICPMTCPLKMEALGELGKVFTFHGVTAWQKKALIISLYLPLADPGGAAGTCPPNQFFQFCMCFTEKCTCQRSAPPKGSVPPNGKSWIRHCLPYLLLTVINIKTQDSVRNI